MSFQSLGLSKPILDGIRTAGYEAPTDIQRQAIPIALSGRNIIALGETGSGKTAAFGLPMLERLSRGEPGLRAIILVPTRELCVQVAENLRIYASHTDLRVCTAFGGIPIMIQEAAFRRGLDVLVACPGRLIDHISSGNLELNRVECLCLDEADRMLDMGFIPQIQKILSFLPKQRQNSLFSATMPPEIEKLVKDYVGEAERVQIGRLSQAAATITHQFEEVRADEKDRILEKILRSRRGRVLIFVKRKTRAEQLGRQLKRAGLPADSIHGDKGAEQRHVVLKAFERGKILHLVATDVAARGIDVKEIELVVNYDMPMAMEDYIHRSGRTGRAGDEGEALSLITRLDKGMEKQILDHLTKADDHARIVVNGRELRAPKRAAKAAAAGASEPANEARREARPASRQAGDEREARAPRRERSHSRDAADRGHPQDRADDTRAPRVEAPSKPRLPSGIAKQRNVRLQRSTESLAVIDSEVEWGAAVFGDEPARADRRDGASSERPARTGPRDADDSADANRGDRRRRRPQR